MNPMINHKNAAQTLITCFKIILSPTPVSQVVLSLQASR
jgi:hypothetical protein